MHEFRVRSRIITETTTPFISVHTHRMVHLLVIAMLITRISRVSTLLRSNLPAICTRSLLTRATLPNAQEDKSFRDDFIGTRIFVSNVPPEVDWMEFKDHFKGMGFNVVYASVSKDSITGKSKGHGIVQFEHKSDVIKCFESIHKYNLRGNVLSAREDRQEKRGDGERSISSRSQPRQDRRTPSKPAESPVFRIRKWKLADGYTLEGITKLGVNIAAVEVLLLEREKERNAHNFTKADEMRDKLRSLHRVQVEDKTRSWKPLMARAPVKGATESEVDDFFNDL